MYLASLPWIVIALAGCGRSAPAPATQPSAPSAPAVAPAGAPASADAAPHAVDECCCPFASAEGVAYNFSPRDACEAAGTGCVEDSACAP